MAELNDKQLAFCREYIIDLNKTQAAIRAGYSEKTASAIASRLLKNVNVKAEIDRLIEKRSQRTEVTADRVIEQLAKIAFMDMKDFVDWGIREISNEENPDYPERIPFVNIKDPDQVDGTLVQSIKMGKYGMVIEFPDRMRALEALAKHTGVFEDRPNVNVDVNGFVAALKETAQKIKGSGGGIWDDDPDNESGGPDGTD